LANADYEKGTLKEIVEARSNATSIKLNVDDLNEESMAKFQKAQDQFGQSLGRLMAISENYPTLKANDAFLGFQSQYEGMENRITKARTDYNDIAGDFNTYIMKFPKNIWAKLFGFTQKPYFENDKGSELAPDIKSRREN
jgi:LemA protein